MWVTSPPLVFGVHYKKVLRLFVASRNSRPNSRRLFLKRLVIVFPSPSCDDYSSIFFLWGFFSLSEQVSLFVRCLLVGRDTARESSLRLISTLSVGSSPSFQTREFAGYSSEAATQHRFTTFCAERSTGSWNKTGHYHPHRHHHPDDHEDEATTKTRMRWDEGTQPSGCFVNKFQEIPNEKTWLSLPFFHCSSSLKWKFQTAEEKSFPRMTCKGRRCLRAFVVLDFLVFRLPFSFGKNYSFFFAPKSLECMLLFLLKKMMLRWVSSSSLAAP